MSDHIRVQTSPLRSARIRLALPWLSVLLGLGAVSCSSTRLVSFSNAGTKGSTPVSSVVTVMVDDRSYLRAALENRLTARLQKRGVEAHSSYREVTLSQLQGDKEQARQALSAWDADAVLVSKLIDRTDVSQAPQFVSDLSHWEEAWAAPANRTTFETSPWGGEVTVTVHLESKLYRLSTAELLWVGYTETQLREFTDDMKRIEAVSRQVVAQLAKDGLIP